MPYRNPNDETRRSKRYREARREALGTQAPFPKPLRTVHAIKTPVHGLKIAVIPDAQVKPGVPLDHLKHCGKYLSEKQPDVIVCTGDFGDLQSLSTHDDAGSLEFEGARYKKDLGAIYTAMDLLMEPLAKVSWNPYLIFLLGNHEDRITRTINRDKKMEGFMSLSDLRYEEYGWRVFPFLQPVAIAGVAMCHYFPSGVMGKPITTAKALLTKLHMSAYAGHQQGRDIAYAKRADGRDMTAILSGSFYQHTESYLSPFTNNHWRGFYMLHQVKDGSFDEMAVSIDYLKRKFGK